MVGIAAVNWMPSKPSNQSCEKRLSRSAIGGKALARTCERVLPKLSSSQWKTRAEGTEEGVRMFELDFLV